MHSSRRRCKRSTETVQLFSAIRIQRFDIFFHFVHGSTCHLDSTAHDKQHAINRAPCRFFFVCIFLVSQMMSRWKHPFQALSSVDVDTLTREALPIVLKKKKKSSYSCHSKIVFFFFCCCTNCSTQRKELRLALISTMNEKLFDCRQQLIQQTPQLDRRVNKKFLWLVSTKVVDPWSHGLRQLLRGIISLKDNTYRGEGDKRF